ncbi:MAG: hypothetical protein GY811_07275 [Myxococcales bacterium]|nr:hypothetical protein [Myxococcales bacterium]
MSGRHKPVLRDGARDTAPQLLAHRVDATSILAMHEIRDGQNGLSPVIGRKNHNGSKSERGAEVAAIFYSLIGTCRMLKIDSRKYLRAAAEVALSTPGAVLLPHDFQAAQAD